MIEKLKNRKNRNTETSKKRGKGIKKKLKSGFHFSITNTDFNVRIIQPKGPKRKFAYLLPTYRYLPLVGFKTSVFALAKV